MTGNCYNPNHSPVILTEMENNCNKVHECTAMVKRPQIKKKINLSKNRHQTTS